MGVAIGSSIPAEFVLQHHLAQFQKRNTLSGPGQSTYRYDWTRARRTARRKSRRSTSK